MSRDRSDRYKYSEPESWITLGSDRVATRAPAVVSNLEETYEETYHAKSKQPNELRPKAEGEVRELKETSSTVVELKEAPPETFLRHLHMEKLLVNAGCILIRHCFSDGVFPSPDFIRPDVVALGFGKFEKKFEPDQVLCMFETTEQNVSLVFFHVEGMATLFGVGLPFSKVVLKEDSVEIREVKENVWMDCWKEHSGSRFYLFLFDFTDRRSDKATASSSQVSKHIMSTYAAAERLGVGVEGLNEITELTSDLERVSPELKGERPAWVSLIYKQLLAQDWDTIMKTYKKNLSATAENNLGHGHDSAQGKVSTSYSSSEVAHTYLAISGNFVSSLLKGFTGFRVASGEKSNSVTDDQQLRLTVIIYLDPSGYSFYSPLEGTELPYARESGKVKIRSSEAEFELEDYEMAPKVEITFLYDPTVKTRSKRLLTSLDSRFHMDGSISDEKLFGWYHDELRLSFRCCEAKAVMRDKRPSEEEILSDHEQRSFGKDRGSEDSTITQKGRSKEFELAGGYQAFAQLRFKGTSNTELTKGSISRDSISGQVVAICLKDANFAVKNVDAGSQELAYHATIFPPLSYYSKWDKADRELAGASGMMSSVELQIQGNWIIKEQDDAPSQKPRLCSYDFLCQRKLAQHRLVLVPPVKTRKFWKHKEEGKLNVEEIFLLQKLSKQFLLNHSFSHMTFQKLQRSEAYEWDTAYQSTSPVEEIIQ